MQKNIHLFANDFKLAWSYIVETGRTVNQ